jgi:hypothetical protein
MVLGVQFGGRHIECEFSDIAFATNRDKSR